MKKLHLLFLVALIVSNSCEEAEKLADVSFETTLSKTMPVAVSTTDEMTTSIVLDATTGPEIQKYSSKIKSYEITDLMFAIENYSTSIASEIYFDGAIGFSKSTDSAPAKTCPFSPVNITRFAGTGDFEVVPCTNLANEIAVLFALENKVTIYLKGDFTKAPLSFNLRVTAKVKVIANPL
jgi:hypothetical protein